MDRDSRGIVIEIIDSTSLVRFTRPAQRNPLSLAILHELKSTIADLVTRPRIRTIIFTGSDDVFLSGADIRELGELDSDSARVFSKLGQHIFQTIADTNQLTIAAVNGYCMGGGLDLALACDLRVASKAAVFAHPGARLGIITGWGGTQRLPRMIGKARALELFTTAGQLSADEALALGLVTRVADPVVDYAIRVGDESGQKKAPDLSPTP